MAFQETYQICFVALVSCFHNLGTCRLGSGLPMRKAPQIGRKCVHVGPW